MTGAAALTLPDQPTFAAWWKHLASYRPRSIWIGQFPLACVDAAVTRQVPLDQLDSFLLRALVQEGNLGLPDLQTRLGIDGLILARALRGLTSRGLVHETGGVCSATALGCAALENGAEERGQSVRARFHFLTGKEAPPRYLHLPANAAWPAPGRAERPDWPTVLQQCFGQQPEWKEQHRFPQDIGLPEDGAPPSRRIPVLSAATLNAVLISTEAGSRLLGFAARPHDWSRLAQEPTFELRAGWQGTFPELIEPSAAVWRAAWLAWCKDQRLPAAEAEASRLERQDHWLRVAAPRTLTGRLPRQPEGAWLFAGADSCRAACLLHFRSAPV